MIDLRRRFFRLSGINILSNLTVPLAGLVDTAMLGHLRDIRYLAGVALSSLLFDYLYWTFGFLRMGTTGTTAQASGRRDELAVWTVLARGGILAIGIAAVVLVFQLPLRELGFAALAGEPGVEAAGREYFSARIWGAPATLAGFVIIGWLLGLQESRQVLLLTAVANATNIGLDYLFIVRFGWAAQGAGLATMISQYTMVAVGVALIVRRTDRCLPPWSVIADRAEIVRMVRLNRDILVRTLCLVTTFAVFTNLSAVLGTSWLAANSILLRLQSAAAYLIDGAAFAAETLAGILIGSDDRAGLRRLVRLSLLAGVGFAVLFLTAVFAAPHAVLGMMTSHAGVLDQAVGHLAWQIPVLILGALAYMYDGLFLGLTEGKTLRNSMLISALLVFAPIAGAAIALGSNHLLWASMAAFMAARALTLGLAWRGAIPAVRSR